VRALLLKGAKRDAKDNNGKMAVEMIGEHLAESLRYDLE
jgi:hypothetical protein